MSVKSFLALAIGWLVLSAPLQAFNPDCFMFYERFIAPQHPKRDLSKVESVRIGTINLSDLHFVAPVEGLAPPKTLEQLNALARSILESNTDVLVVQEGIGRESIRDFIVDHLHDKFDYVLPRGNDPKNRQIAFLVRKDLPLHLMAYSHSSERWAGPHGLMPLFARDLPFIELRVVGQLETSPPFLTVLGAHYLKRINGDPVRGAHKSAEISRTVEILRALESKGEDLPPLVIAGDFNVNIANAETLIDFRQAGMLESAALLNVRPIDRASHMSGQQMDGMFFNSAFAPGQFAENTVHSFQVHPYRDAGGKVIDVDKLEDRSAYPSTHQLVTTDVRLAPLLKRVGYVPEVKVTAKAAAAAEKVEAKVPTAQEVAHQLNAFIEKLFFEEAGLRLPDVNLEAERELAEHIERVKGDPEFLGALDVDGGQLMADALAKASRQKKKSVAVKSAHELFIDSLELPEREAGPLKTIQVPDVVQAEIDGLDDKDRARLYQQVLLKIALDPMAAYWKSWGTTTKLGSYRLIVDRNDYRVLFEMHDGRPRLVMFGREEALDDLPRRFKDIHSKK